MRQRLIRFFEPTGDNKTPNESICVEPQGFFFCSFFVCFPFCVVSFLLLLVFLPNFPTLYFNHSRRARKDNNKQKNKQTKNKTRRCQWTSGKLSNVHATNQQRDDKYNKTCPFFELPEERDRS